MSLVTPEKIQTLQRKLYLKAKRGSTSTEWEAVGNADTPLPTSLTRWASSVPLVRLGNRASLENEPGPRAGCGKPARPVR